MCGDLFSSFDFYVFSLFGFLSCGMWIGVFVVGFLLVQGWHPVSSVSSLDSLFVSIVSSLVRSSSILVTGIASLGGSLMFVLLVVNLAGLVPYVFSVSSHVSFTFSCGLTLWVAVVLSSVFFSSYSFLIHLCPLGAPVVLGWFLSLIELVSISLRPITLSVRLAANMSAGHVVLSLMATSVSLSVFSYVFLVPVLMAYTLFEVGICFVQALVFYLLSVSYFDEHS